MKLDYSVARQFGSKIPDNKVSTEEIKAGLERIKKAQEQVLLQLKKSHPDSSIDVKNTNFDLYHAKKTENEHLTRQLTVERQKSIQKSSLYRRRVVDLQSSLNVHAQHEQKLNQENRILSEENKALEAENRMLQEQLRSVRQKYADLEMDYHRLVEQSEKSNKNLRNFQKQVLQFNKRLQQDDIKNLRAQFQTISSERNSMMAEKVNLLKNYSKVQSENIELKSKITNLLSQQQKQRELIREKQQLYERQIESLRLKSNQWERQEVDQKKRKEAEKSEKNNYKYQDVIIILNQINKMNLSHQYIFNTLKSNSKLSHVLIQKENIYQNSLNKILQMINILQKNTQDSGSNEFLFDHDQSFREEIHRVQNQLIKKHKKQLFKQNSDKQELISKIKMKDIKIQELQNDYRRQEEKISQIRKQKKELMEQISALSGKVSQLNQIIQKSDKQKFKDSQKKQQRNDEEYRAIILQLNSQMGTIQKQKKELDNLIRSMANSKSEEQQKNKKKLNEIADKNQEISVQNEKIKQKYEAILIEKEHLYLNLCEAQNKNDNLNKQIARELINKQKLISELNKLRQQKQLHSTEVQKYKLMTENGQRQIEKVNNGYLVQVQRLVHEGLHLRQQIQLLCKDRNELRELKSRYGLLLKDNKILGQKALHVNSQIDHLWMIKEVQYSNLNKVLNELKPLE